MARKSKYTPDQRAALRKARQEKYWEDRAQSRVLAEYQAKGIKRYKFVSAIDSRTCDVCADLNGQVFNVADAKTGLNFPPMHPNCRSVTTPVIDWDDEDEWDYSGIELDDDELKKLGLTDEDVSAIDADTPKDTSAPAPSLSVQQANQATEDTQSVQRRAELAEAVKQQGDAIEIKARNLYDKDIGNIFDEIERNEKLNQKFYADTPIILPQAAIEAEHLDDVRTKILKAELEAEKLQLRAAKLDESVPKPDPKRAAAFEDEIDKRTDARKRRQDADLPDDEVVKQATPKPFDLPEPDASDAIEPRTAFGKWWLKVRDGVAEAKERFDAWVHGFSGRADLYMPPSQMASKTLVEDGTVLRKIDHEKEYKAILQEQAQNKSFNDFVLEHVETSGWNDPGHECVPRLDVLKEAHRRYSEYLANGGKSKEIEFHFGHSNNEAFNMDCHEVFGDSDEMDRYQDAGGAFGVTEKGEWVLVVRSTITMDGLHHEIGHAIHERYLSKSDKKDPVLTDAVKRVRISTQRTFAPFGVDRQATPVDPPKSGFELILLKALSGKKQYKTIDDYNADANQYAGLVTAFHNINAIIHSDAGHGIHYGESVDILHDPSWKELFANSTTILLSDNEKAIKFFNWHYGPIAQYVQERLALAKRGLE